MPVPKIVLTAPERRPPPIGYLDYPDRPLCCPHPCKHSYTYTRRHGHPQKYSTNRRLDSAEAIALFGKRSKVRLRIFLRSVIAFTARMQRGGFMLVRSIMSPGRSMTPRQSLRRTPSPAPLESHFRRRRHYCILQNFRMLQFGRCAERSSYAKLSSALPTGPKSATT